MPAKHTTIIRIRPEIYESLLQLSELSRRPVSAIASDAVEFALRHKKLTKADCYDVTFEEKEDK